MKNKSSLSIGLLFVLIFSFGLIACGKKEAPIPQKTDQLFSFQDVYVHMNEEGSLSVVGSINGTRKNVQALELQIEGYDEACPTCPFVPVEVFTVNPRETWEGIIPADFSFTVLPAKQFRAYRFRLIGHNNIAGLPQIMTSVLKIEAPIVDNRPYVEFPVNQEK